MSGETVWAVDADEARYEHDRVEAEEPWLLDADDKPTRGDLVGAQPSTRLGPGAMLRSRDPWQAEALEPGARVFHRSRAHDPEVRLKGSGAVAESRRLGDDLEYLIDYDKGGQGWHGSSDVHPAIGDADAPF